jgi:PEGA domain-containing protein
MNRLLVVAGFVLISACATIMHGSSQEVGISSSPTGAKVTIDNMPLGVTPVVAHLRRKDNHTIKIEMDGYQPFEMATTRKVSGWVWGNIVFGGLIGLAVDAITGGLYNVNPDQVSGTLVKRTSALDRGPDVMVVVVLHPDPKWVRIGTLERW